MISKTQGIGLLSASWGGGPVAPFIGFYILRRNVGFKATFISALGIACAGNLMFWPSGALQSYPAFVVSSSVLGFGVNLFELTSVTFWMLCGTPQSAEFRVLLGVGFNGIASTVGILLAQKVFFVHAINHRTLIDLQWAYLSFAFVTVFLGFVFYYVPLPEATDSEVQSQAERLGIDHSQKYFGTFPVHFTTLAIGTLSMFCAWGKEICFQSFSGELFSSVSTRTKTTLDITISDFNTEQSRRYCAFHLYSHVLSPPLFSAIVSASFHPDETLRTS